MFNSGQKLQIGFGFNPSDAAVHVLDQIEGTSNRTQTLNVTADNEVGAWFTKKLQGDVA